MTKPFLVDRGCPFCGSRNLKASSRQMGGANRYYICQVRCLKCGARGPIVRSDKMDYREILAGNEEVDLALKAFRKFNCEEDIPADDLFAEKKED
jgi:hypothetical protein